MAEGGKNETSLENVTVGRDFVGRDNNSTTIVQKYESSSYIKDLYEKFQIEKLTDPELKELCDELNIFNTQVQNENVIGLDNKLKAGGKVDYYIEYATALKDQFYKKLMVNAQLSFVAQEINIHLLSKIKRTFRLEIFPMICRCEPIEKVEQTITERIVNPVRAELGVNLFKYTDEDISGMIFYLTGNCHLKWAE